MIQLFRKIRFRLISQAPSDEVRQRQVADLTAGKAGNRFNRYLLYAFGEIILVVVGILLALQVNNWNIEKSNRTKEEKYLKNMVLDLEKDLASLEYLIQFREERLAGDRKLISQMNGAPIENITELSYNILNTLMEERFTPNNNTYSELSSSGNLNLIANDSIKVLLLELEQFYKLNQFGIDHETFDYQEYISKEVVKTVDVEKIFPIFLGQKTAEELGVNREYFDSLLANTTYKNGLFITTIMSESFISTYKELKAKSLEIKELIELDLRRN